MELTNEFVVAVPVEQAWAVLTDVERIAPCLPGAELQEVEGDDYRGIVKVKVGPITASYKGTARFVEKDDTAHRGVLKAEGRETRGQGNASATIVATLSPSGEGTKVEVVTDLAITGKVAQFGRGVLADVSGKLLEQFVHNLESMVLAPAAASPAGDAGSPPGAATAATADAPAVAAPKAAGRAKPARSKATAKAAAPAPASSGGDATAPSHDAVDPAGPGKSDVAKDASESAAAKHAAAESDAGDNGSASESAAAKHAAAESDAGDNGSASESAAAKHAAAEGQARRSRE
ncbi:MAG: SRPBCC family protein [Acidimicrobiales bacterium]